MAAAAILNLFTIAVLDTWSVWTIQVRNYEQISQSTTEL